MLVTRFVGRYRHGDDLFVQALSLEGGNGDRLAENKVLNFIAMQFGEKRISSVSIDTFRDDV